MCKAHQTISKLIPGTFFADPENKVLQVELLEICEREATVNIGAFTGCRFTVQHNTALALAEFFGDIAKQTKPK